MRAKGRRAGLGGLRRDPHPRDRLVSRRAPATRRSGPLRDAELGTQTLAPWRLLRRGPLHFGRLPFLTPPSTESLDGIRFPALLLGSLVFQAEQCGGFSFVLQKSHQGLQGTGLIFFFF